MQLSHLNQESSAAQQIFNEYITYLGLPLTPANNSKGTIVLQTKCSGAMNA